MGVRVSKTLKQMGVRVSKALKLLHWSYFVLERAHLGHCSLRKEKPIWIFAFLGIRIQNIIIWLYKIASLVYLFYEKSIIRVLDPEPIWCKGYYVRLLRVIRLKILGKIRVFGPWSHLSKTLVTHTVCTPNSGRSFGLTQPNFSLTQPIFSFNSNFWLKMVKFIAQSLKLLKF